MNKQRILIPGLLVLGIVAGIAMIQMRDTVRSTPAQTDTHTSPTLYTETTQHPMANAFVVSQPSDSERIQTLESQIALLNQRIDELEQVVAVAPDVSTDSGALLVNSPSTADTPVSGLSPALNTDTLVRAGIDEMLAADIVRRINEIDLKKLELRDRASREGYLGTGQYSRELNALLEQDISLRDEIGDDSYDSYLYAAGQSNRVKVTSVMMGSPAEMAGMKDGDMVLSYGNNRMFSWNELQQETSLGERGEYVNVSVLRNGQLVNLWVPRGPLGVRLGSARVKP